MESVSGFNVCLPQPDGYAHSFCLLELSELLTFSLQDLGYDATFSINDIYPDRRNIIVGCHLVPQELIDRMPESTIVVNTEQIYDEDRFEWNTTIFAWVRAFETWDYSPRNVAAFAVWLKPGGGSTQDPQFPTPQRLLDVLAADTRRIAGRPTDPVAALDRLQDQRLSAERIPGNLPEETCAGHG